MCVAEFLIHVFLFIFRFVSKMDKDFRSFERAVNSVEKKYRELENILVTNSKSDIVACDKAIESAAQFSSELGNKVVFPITEAVHLWMKV